MALADLSNATATIANGPTTFEVGPLSASDLAELRRQHIVHLFDMIELHASLLEGSNEVQRAYGATTIFLEMADAVAHAIALAAREPDRIAEAASLGVGTQIQALTTIAQLSLNAGSLAALPTDLQDIVTRVKALRPEEIN